MPTALVTGPTAGIGLEFARQLAARGHDLVLVARDTARLDALAADLRTTYGVDTEVLTADLSDRTQLAAVEERVASTDRPVDLLVNNAGFGLKKRFLDNDVEQEQAMLDVLVVAVMRLSHAALGAMTARGSGGIINISSVAAYLRRGSYSAAKAYVNSFGAWAATEYRPRGVTVTTVCPGFVKTEFHQRMDVRRGSGFLWMDADYLVSEALKDFDKGKALSIPRLRYRAVVAASHLVPASVAQRFQNVGRR
jgi:short-subunit dehydrogenase